MKWWLRDRFGAMPASRPVGGDRPGLSVADKRRLQDLLHQQMWCWGRDVLHQAPPGNLLIWAGMNRHRATDSMVEQRSAASRGSNRYEMELDPDHSLSIWAFGAAVCHPGGGGVFLHRYQRGIRMLPDKWLPTGVHHTETLPPLRRPVTPEERWRAVRLLDRLMLWIERYERAVLDRFGPEYRKETLNNWEHPLVEGPAMADEWLRLARIYRRANSAAPMSLSSLRAP